MIDEYAKTIMYNDITGVWIGLTRLTEHLRTTNDILSMLPGKQMTGDTSVNPSLIM